MDDRGEIIIYQTEDGLTKIDVSMQDETVWLTQEQMAELFQRDKSTISRHLKNIFAEGELDEKVVVAEFATTSQHGAMEGRTQSNITKFYNLDVIISVGYRVKSQRGVQFRIWAANILKEYIKKGFAMDDDRLKDLGGGGYFKSYWKESVTSGLLKRYFIVRYWKSMRPVLTTILTRKSPYNFSNGYRTRSIMPFPVRLLRR